ncbi:choline/glycine/proline betaine transport protein [Halogranum amylolyticum]|uniref:Choline/glycine/proline betaine transport protein n=1 Tax=Halogranum amylolyticum TaxID=660520 RepID=A0A1H8VBJ0_9EURY|nr:BCCT family transporter [Halogranum amylolyticum]SEP12218.1 choline/glycine/proline betaine transport protein [Halogranum amylolyticum]
MADSEKTTGEMSDGLQVELFHPDSDRKPGDTNLQGYGFDIHPIVFPVALVIIALFVAVTLLLGGEVSSFYTAIFNGINTYFGWFYIAVVNIFIIVVLYFAVSKYGQIRIGGVEAEKEFSTFSWMAMLFSAGMGIGLMFFSVAEPMYYFDSIPPFFAGSATSNTAAAAGPAFAQTFFHWGLHPWATYALVGLGLAFFSFNRGLPLTFRSIFWPLLGERIYSWPGHLIDLVSVFATLFGLSTSLGLGVKQINTGLNIVGKELLGIGIPVGTFPQVALIAVITLIATASVAAGLDNGVKRLSTINVYFMFLMLGFLLLVGPTLYILSGLVNGLGVYFISLPSLSFFTGAFAGKSAKTFLGSWTIFYWGWWISWAPFVGMFIARISKGRTIREFVLGVLILPSAFSFMWLSTFGGSALSAQLAGGGILAALSNQGQTIAMFSMLSQYPLSALSSTLATTLVVTFFVTSSDSGSLVVDHLTSGGKHDAPRVQRIFWALIQGSIAALLLIGGGLGALQTAAVTTGLPFAIILLLMCYTVYLGLKNEYEILESEEFRDHIQEVSDSEDIAVTSAGGDVVTNISRGEEVADD